MSQESYVSRWRREIVQSDLTTAEKALALGMSVIAMDSAGEGCFASIPTIARWASVRQDTARKIIRRLVRDGFLTVTPRRGHSSVYRALIPTEPEGTPPLEQEGFEHGSTEPVEPVDFDAAEWRRKWEAACTPSKREGSEA
jgi:Helix-turn-helix domain